MHHAESAGQYGNIETVPVRAIQLLFEPNGLPLVYKTHESPTHESPTTSVLIQGDAGSGKSTLALLIATAIAEKIGRPVYYLLTEQAVIEVVHRARVIGIDPSLVRSWPVENGIGLDHVAIHHVDGDGDDDIIKPIECAYSRIRDATLAPSVVVIDAIGWACNPASRSCMLTFIQAAEARGTSVVVVQEQDAQDTRINKLPHAVDVIIRILSAGSNKNHLRCKKSRYSKVGDLDVLFSFAREE
jgi:KaiC/GvpD/RAD55 family RecA-like ATPase